MDVGRNESVHLALADAEAAVRDEIVTAVRFEREEQGAVFSTRKVPLARRVSTSQLVRDDCRRVPVVELVLLCVPQSRRESTDLLRDGRQLNAFGESVVDVRLDGEIEFASFVPQNFTRCSAFLT